jgi:hypothetical protein
MCRPQLLNQNHRTRSDNRNSLIEPNVVLFEKNLLKAFHVTTHFREMRAFSEPVVNSKSTEITAIGSSSKSFDSWISTTSSLEIVALLRSFLVEIEVDRQILDYHLKLTSNKSSWQVTVYYGKKYEGPLKVDRCMSCDLDCPLSLGVYGVHQEAAKKEILSSDCLLKQSLSSRVWLDGKAREMFIVTPIAHKERLSELSDEELVDVFKQSVQILLTMNCPRFICMIINHGCFRNHAHLHLKVKIHRELFETAKQGWSEDVRKMFNKILLQKL